MSVQFSFISQTLNYAAESKTPIFFAISKTPIYSYSVNGMTTPNCEEIVFKGFNNENSITVKKTINGVTSNEQFDLSRGITRMTVEFAGTDIIADSNESSDSIDWEGGDGLIVFRFGELNIPDGRYKATLKIWDDENPDGFVIFYAETDGLRFRFVS